MYSVRSEHRGPVLADEIGQLGVFTILYLPDIVGCGRCMVLAVGILGGDIILVENHSGLVDSNAPGTLGRHAFGHGKLAVGSSEGLCEIDAVQRRRSLGEGTGFGRELVECSKKYLAIRRNCKRSLSSAVVGQALGSAALDGHGPDILRALAVRSEYHILAVRAPEWLGIMCGIGGKLDCLATGRRNHPDIALINEGDFAPIGRYGILTEPTRSFIGGNDGA